MYRRRVLQLMCVIDVTSVQRVTSFFILDGFIFFLLYSSLCSMVSPLHPTGNKAEPPSTLLPFRWGVIIQQLVTRWPPNERSRSGWRGGKGGRGGDWTWPEREKKKKEKKKKWKRLTLGASDFHKDDDDAVIYLPWLLAPLLLIFTPFSDGSGDGGDNDWLPELKRRHACFSVDSY